MAKSKVTKAGAKFSEKKARSEALAHLGDVLAWLSKAYPDSSTELTYDSPFQLVTAVILSAQCTDARVNLTTPALFKRFPDAASLASGELEEIEGLIKSCGFYRNKAKSIKGMAQALLDKHGGEVPNTLEELVELPGVGRKTASVVMNQAFHLPAIAVDTHVMRVSQRLNWTRHKDPVKIEMDLRELLPKNEWADINGRLVLHGRRTCKARKPLCNQCGLPDYCPYFETHYS